MVLSLAKEESKSRQRAAMAAYYIANRERILKRDRERWASSPETREARKVYAKAYRQRPETKAKVRSEREQRIEYNKSYYRRPGSAARVKELHMIREYGLTMVEYQNLLLGQNNQCAVCGKANWGKHGPQVDHDHTTGRVRGLLCMFCNMALGSVMDDKKIVLKMVEYLEKHEAENGNS